MLELNMVSPTLVHGPIGSKCTPFWSNILARSLRFVLSVLVRMVSGRATSLDSTNSRTYVMI